jgi:hypothetical protein
VQRLTFDEASVPAIAAELAAAPTVAAYRVRDQPAYELRVPCAALPGATVLLVLWCSLGRVDVRLLPADGASPAFALTRKEVRAVEIYPGVEVMFRRASGGVLFVTRNGVVGLSD